MLDALLRRYLIEKNDATNMIYDYLLQLLVIASRESLLARAGIKDLLSGSCTVFDEFEVQRSHQHTQGDVIYSSTNEESGQTK